MIFKIIAKASSIPLGAEVTKVKGEKVYIIKDRIRIFPEDGRPKTQQEIVAEDNSFFLVSGNGDINVVGGKKELVWHADIDELGSFLDELRDGGFDQ
jgi:hypothetical protein